MVDDAAAVRTWRILVAAPFPPRLDGRHGGSRSVAQLLAGLTARHSVALLVLRAHDEPGVDDILRNACDLVEEVEIPRVGTSFGARLIYRIRLRAALLRGMPTWAAERTTSGFGARLEELVNTWCPDVVQLEYRVMGQFLPALAACSKPCVLTDYDPASAEGSRSSLRALVEERAWKSLGRAVSRQVDLLVALTDRDRETLSELGGATPVTRIPLGYDLPASPLDPTGTDPYGIVFVGSFIHLPNADAASWLARNIFPSVKARVPGASLLIIGSHAPTGMRALDGAGLTVKGEVPDVRPYLDAAAVVAAPIRMGSGMRVKVLEALAGGKAIVATPLALEGLDVKDGEHVVVAGNEAEFVDALVELLTDAERRTAIAKAARRWAEQNLDLDPRVRAYEALYSSLVESHTRSGWAESALSGGPASFSRAERPT
jgi:glycosyltransferase involved in cell wall biosynthesis